MITITMFSYDYTESYDYNDSYDYNGSFDYNYYGSYDDNHNVQFLLQFHCSVVITVTSIYTGPGHITKFSEFSFAALSSSFDMDIT